jgi:hypothetical protein
VAARKPAADLKETGRNRGVRQRHGAADLSWPVRVPAAEVSGEIVVVTLGLARQPLERHPELPGNTVSREFPGRLRWSARSPRMAATGQYANQRSASAGYGLFPGGPGRTTTPEAFSSLMSGLEERVFGRLPDATWIYPGHGNDSTLDAERPHLAEWRARGW